MNILGSLEEKMQILKDFMIKNSGNPIVFIIILIIILLLFESIFYYLNKSKQSI